MDTQDSGSRFGNYVRANRAFFAFLGVIVLSVFGYFWWRSGFTLEFSKFFASCETGDCDDDGYDNPFVRGNDCDDGNPGIGGSASCRWCQADQVQGGQTCGDGDCDDDGHDNPSVGGDDCDDGNWCNDGGGCGAPPPPPPPPPPPVYTCTQTGNQQCIGVSCGTAGLQGGSGTCPGGQNCCRTQAAPSAPTADLTASPGTVAPGGRVTITWSSTNATSCETLAGNFVTGGPSGTTSETIDPNTTATSVGFRIQCSGPGGTALSPVRTVQISGPPVEPEHLVCENNACRLVPGGGPNQSGCTAAGQSCTQATHLGCVNTSGAPVCTVVEGGPPNTDGCNTPGQSCTMPQGAGICAGYPDRWGSNGVVVCRISSNFVNDRCTINGDGHTMTYTVGIYNGSTEAIYSKPALFFTPNQTCGAHADNPSNARGLVSGDTSLLPTRSGQTTYTFTPSDCGSYQLDDTWGPGNFVFVIGNVINTGRNCVVPTTPPPTTIIPPATHLECVSNACTRVAGGGANACSPEGSACTHLECISNACTRVTGPGGNLCTPEGGTCGVTPTHLECVSNACTRVNGAGTDGCSPQGSTCGVTTPPLECVGTLTQAAIGQAVPFSATGGTGSYSWFAPNGTPGTGGGSPFSTAYSIAGFKTVTVVSGGNQATCTVTINAPQTSTPPPTTIIPPTTTVIPSCTPAICTAPPAGCTYQGGTTCTCGELVCPSNVPFVCAPVSQEVSIGQSANLVVGGGTAPFTWTATGGNPPSSSGSSRSFSTRYSSAGNYLVRVSSGSQTATCGVVVRTTPTPTDTTITIPTTPALTIAKTVRNVTANGPDTETANADPGHTVEFTIRVSSTGTGTATQVTVRDALPSGLNYQAGTTTIDGVAAADGITGSGISLGDMVPGRTIVIRFRAVVADASFFPNGSTTLVNTAFARGSNTAEVSDNAQVIVTRGQGFAMSISKLGRNITRGESAEHTPVNSSPGQTIEFVIRVRNTSTAALTNVLVRDVLPERVTFVPGTVRLNGQPAADTLVTSGLPIGTLSAGAEAVITFSGRVAADTAFTTGTVTLINTVQATADGVPLMQAQLPIIVTTGAVVTVPTGPGESTLLALIISALITLLYVGYTSTESFRRREAAGLAGHAHDDKGLFDFKR